MSFYPLYVPRLKASGPTIHPIQGEAMSSDTQPSEAQRTKPPMPGQQQDQPQPQQPRPHTRNFVFTDPVAFRFLEEDRATTVISRRATLTGYEVYIVEKWACSRVHPTFVINTNTGDPSHTITVYILSIPADKNAWSHRLRLYFNAIADTYAHETETPLGALMVTNLSSFPSDLTVIPVPSGDVVKHRLHFIVNEDLKRLGCSGRSGFTLQHPSPATEAKFYQLYKAHERVPLYEAVIELVKQCQMALAIFDLLPAEYVDGLLCDLTEKAINDWWTIIGTDLYNTEPTDGILGPTTVSALLGTLMGARNRLSAYGAPVSKNVFDVHSLKKGIASFQKSQKLERTRRFDRVTLERLHRVTAKAASGDAGWAVPRAVKSTVVELGGKGGEMVMGMVGGKDKAGISEVETLDIERFIQLLHGERSKWLWHGKPRKTGNDVFRQSQSGGGELMVFTQDDQGGYLWTSSKKEKELSPSYPLRNSLDDPTIRQPSEVSNISEERDVEREKTTGERVSGGIKKSVGRFRDAVGIPGLRSHHHKRSKEAVEYEEDIGYRPADSMHSNEVAIEDPAPDHQRQSKEYTPGAETAFGTAYGPPSDTFADLSPTPSRQEALRAQQAGIVPPMDLEQMRTEDTAYADYATSLNQPSDELRLPSRPIFRHYRRARSLSPPPAGQRRSSFPKGYARCPRHLSFSVAEDVVLPWEPIAEFDFEHETEGPIDDIDAEMATENLLVLELQQLNAKIRYLADVAGPWVESQLELAGKLDGEYQSKAEALTALYEKKLDNYRMLQINVAETTARESSSVAEEIKKVELLGAKLDYEISVLQSKVADVEAGLIDYESHVILIENRIRRVIGEARGTITRSAAGPGVGGDIDSHSGGGGSTWKLRKDWLAGLWTVVSATGT